MIRDTTYRHLAALDPSALAYLPGALHALARAIEDCRSVSIDPAGDPAVLLLARNLAQVTAAQAPAMAILRTRCAEAVALISGRALATDEAATSPLPLAA